jgi:uncharacterized protein (TIGR00369 family)
MTGTTQPLTLDRVRSARERIHAYIDEEMRGLGGDPATFAAQAAAMDGLDFFSQWVQSEIPPPPALGVMFNTEWVEVEPARVALVLEPAEWMLNPISGALWGGISATVLDIVLGAAIHTTLPAGTAYATSDLHTRYVRPVTAETGRLMASATVLHTGRTHATPAGRIEVEATGKLIATATAGLTILRPAE